MTVTRSDEGMAQGADGSGEEAFDYGELLERHLGPDGSYDADQEWLASLRSNTRLSGATVIPPAESLQRVQDPLPSELKESFGKYALAALFRNDLFDVGLDDE